ncbi:MAG: hypothetical protein DCC71_01420 [Proteobacteria bacterium]|nr:MAG: hypothetical protein DCC71_01420 [Pseudomonadota bacterium]
MAGPSWAGPPATGGTDTIGAYVPALERFFLRNANSSGAADAGNFKFNVTPAASDELPVMCDWNGDGTSTVGVYVPAIERFYLRNANSAGAADAGNFKFNVTPAGGDEVPVAGDWNGDGTCTIGVYVPAIERFYLRNSNSSGAADAGNFKFNVTPAGSDETPVVGDWNGDGSSTIGSYAPAIERFFLRNANSAGAADAGNFKFNVTPAASDELPLTGDWNNDGTGTIGAYVPAIERYYLRNANSAGAADAGNFKFNVTPAGGDESPVASDWDGN